MLWLKRTLAALGCAAVASLALLSMPDGVQTTVSWFVAHAQAAEQTTATNSQSKKGLSGRELMTKPLPFPNFCGIRVRLTIRCLNLRPRFRANSRL